MTRCALPLLLVAAVGCSGQPPTVMTAKPVDPGPEWKAIDLPAGPPPTALDPVAAKTLDAAVAAHTGGKPELLDKLRSVRYTRTGQSFVVNQPLVWRSAARYPDKVRGDAEMPGVRLTITRNGAGGWQHLAAPGRTKVALTDAEFKGVLADTSAEWLAVLVPLADPGRLAVPLPKRELLGKPAVGVWLVTPHLPPAVAYFDEGSNQLILFAYQGHENGQPVTKEVAVGGTETVNGVAVPSKLKVNWNGRPALEWSVAGVEFPAAIDDKQFTDP